MTYPKETRDLIWEAIRKIRKEIEEYNGHYLGYSKVRERAERDIEILRELVESPCPRCKHYKVEDNGYPHCILASTYGACIHETMHKDFFEDLI